GCGGSTGQRLLNVGVLSTAVGSPFNDAHVIHGQGGDHLVRELLGVSLGDTGLAQGVVDVAPQGAALFEGAVDQVARVDVHIGVGAGDDGAADRPRAAVLVVVQEGGFNGGGAVEGALGDAYPLAGEVSETLTGLVRRDGVGHQMSSSWVVALPALARASASSQSRGSWMLTLPRVTLARWPSRYASHCAGVCCAGPSPPSLWGRWAVR